MQNEFVRSISIAGNKIQYDTQCKKVLAQKVILARILKGTAEEFREMPIDEIEQCIEGTPEISTIPVLPGETNHEQITGMANEDKIDGEGTVYFDIRFQVYVPALTGKIKIIINIEAQKKFNPGYQIVTRGIYYCARMISAQLGTEFSKSEYDSIKKVYSIWICMNAPEQVGNTISEYCLEKHDLVGYQPTEQESYDKLTVIIVTLNEKKESQDELTGMLNTLFSPVRRVREKKRELEEKYFIKMDSEAEKEMDGMCNLSDWVEEIGMEKGIERGKIQMVEALLRQEKLADSDIAEAAGISVEELQKIKENLK